MKKIIKTKALFRIQDWANVSMSCWWAPLAMLIMKDNPTAVMYQGTLYNADGTKGFHAWVEFNIQHGGRYVLDFSWFGSGFCEKKRFLRLLKKTNVRLVPRWGYDYSTFWLFRWTNSLWELMLDPKTSHILDGLDVLCPEDESNFGFKPIIADLEMEKLKGFGVATIPWEIKGSDKMISASIIQDFVKYPKRKAPRDKTIKKMRRLIRESEVEEEKEVV